MISDIARVPSWIDVAHHLLGKEALISVFKRIDQLQLPQIENAKNRCGWIAPLWPMPNITERIKYLEKN